MFSNIFRSITGQKAQPKSADISEQETEEKSGNLSNSEKDLELRMKLENLKMFQDGEEGTLEGIVDSNTIVLNSESEIRGGKLETIDESFDPVKLFEIFVKEKLSKFSFSQLKDESRPSYANKSTGGIELTNKELTSLIRSVGYEIIKQIGRKIISGDFNLTTVSFPIKVMLHLTILQTIAKSVFQFPIYLNLAAMESDPLEKFKYVITATISNFHNSSHFLKPLNPILGETFELAYEDGGKIYLEQSSHHPPISHYIMYGPNNLYKFHGYSNFNSSAGFNSLKLYNKGKRFFEFKDGTKIMTNFCMESYSNTFLGTIRHESLGETVFKDLTNGFECAVKYGSVKKKPSDFFTGDIILKGINVCKIYGSYLSHIEFNDVRYWDIRENIPVKSYDVNNQLPSSSLVRMDRVLLEQRKVVEAQAAKEKLEELQRHDRKMREKFNKSSHK